MISFYNFTKLFDTHVFIRRLTRFKLFTWICNRLSLLIWIYNWLCLYTRICNRLSLETFIHCWISIFWIILIWLFDKILVRLKFKRIFIFRLKELIIYLWLFNFIILETYLWIKWFIHIFDPHLLRGPFFWRIFLWINWSDHLFDLLRLLYFFVSRILEISFFWIVHRLYTHIFIL
jgi:hypothetical protein